MIKPIKSRRKTTYPLLKKYKLNAIILAKFFEYRNANSLRNSSCYHTTLRAVERIIEHIELEKK